MRRPSIGDTVYRMTSPTTEGTLAVSEAQTVERDDPVPGRHLVDESAALDVLGHAAVAVDEHHRFSVATVHVMEANLVDLDKGTLL